MSAETKASRYMTVAAALDYYPAEGNGAATRSASSSATVDATQCIIDRIVVGVSHSSGCNVTISDHDGTTITAISVTGVGVGLGDHGDSIPLGLHIPSGFQVLMSNASMTVYIHYRILSRDPS